MDEKDELTADSPSLAHPSRSSDRYQEAKPSAVNGEEDYDSDISETFQRKTVAEMRNVSGDSGDMEVYLMDEENVEVAYVDEADEAVEDEKGRKECRESNETSAGAVEENNDAPPKADEDDVIPPQEHRAGKVQRKTRRGKKANKSCKDAPNDSIPAAADEELAPVASYEYYQPGDRQSAYQKLIERQQIFEKQSKEEDFAESSHLGGVSAAIAITQRSPRHKNRSSKVLYSKRPVYRQSYEERTREFRGYSDVDFYSLSDATAINQEAHRLDEDSWEDRDVKQRFLHEKSISLSRNWFGKSSAFFNPHDAHVYLPFYHHFYFYLAPSPSSYALNTLSSHCIHSYIAGSVPMTRGNDRNFESVCHPKSMPMPLDQFKQRLPQPGEWEEEWYMSWKARKENPNALFSRRENRHALFSTSSSKKGDVENTSTQVRDKYALDDEDPSYTDGEENIPDDKIWKEPPEFGKLCTVRYKVGEPRSRLNWFLTSRLRRSRFRKKYFSARP